MTDTNDADSTEASQRADTDRPAASTADDRPVRYAIGLMAGTSLDGIDAACCRIAGRPGPDDPFGYEVTIESFVTEPYPDDLRRRLVELCDDDTGTVDEVCRMNAALGVKLAETAERAREEAGVDPDDVAVVGSHGQTIWHVPDRELLPGTDRRSRSTLQIGDGSAIAHETGVTTVSNFRTRDVAADGHAAPLAPFADATLFADDENVRVMQNIGGIGNCTVVPPNPEREDVRAFDTGPGNMVMDAVVELLTDGERTYDEDGEIAADGAVDDALVTEFLDDEYFAEEPPKSTGREYFGHEYAAAFIEAGRDRGLADADVVASATMLTARSIAEAYDRFLDKYDEVYVSGGGAYNPTLMAMLREESDAPVYGLDRLGVDPDAKEAALFALLGVARLDGHPNNVPRATGAAAPVVMGMVSRP